MAETDSPLTLEGLAQILRGHMDGTAARFAEVGRGIDDLRGEIGTVAGVVRNLGQIVLRQVDQFEEHRRELEEHRGEIRRIYARMEQYEARTEAMTRDIRRILDAIERRGGNGGAHAE